MEGICFVGCKLSGYTIRSYAYYDSSQKWLEKLNDYLYILFTGNFGHNKDFSYTTKHGVLVRKVFLFIFKQRIVLF